MLTSAYVVVAENPFGPNQITEVDLDRERVLRYMENSRSAATIAAYTRDFARFEAWCAANERSALPATPETVARHISALASNGYAVATIERALAAISVRHKRAGHEPAPTAATSIHETMKGIRRAAADAGRTQRKKTPLTVARLGEILKPFGSSTTWDVRDRALLVLGFAGAFRRSEIVGLDVGDVAFTERGLEVTLRKSKTDQTGEKIAKRPVTIAYGSRLETCPVRALDAWLTRSATTAGPIFRPIDPSGAIGTGRLSAQSVALIIQRRTAQLEGEFDFGGHSLRAGFATTAAAADLPMQHWMHHMRLTSVSVATGYVRSEGLWKENASGRVGL